MLANAPKSSTGPHLAFNAWVWTWGLGWGLQSQFLAASILSVSLKDSKRHPPPKCSGLLMGGCDPATFSPPLIRSYALWEPFSYCRYACTIPTPFHAPPFPYRRHACAIPTPFTTAPHHPEVFPSYSKSWPQEKNMKCLGIQAGNIEALNTFPFNLSGQKV